MLLLSFFLILRSCQYWSAWKGPKRANFFKKMIQILHIKNEWILPFTFYQLSCFKLKNWVHTILGMVELTLQNCPVESAGRNIPHKYYILRPRSAKSKVKGHLQLYVAYVNDGTEPPRCVLTNFFLSILKFYPLDSQNTKKKLKLKCWLFLNNNCILVKLFQKKPR